MSGISSASYSPVLLTHLSNLSITISTANKGYQIGSSITIPKNGIAKITFAGHISGGTGFVYIILQRGNNSYNIGNANNTSSLFTDNSLSGFNSLAPNLLTYSISANPSSFNQLYSSNPFVLEILVLKGDILQFFVGNTNSSTTTYVDDLVVIMQ